jgi:hypothetical protein
MRPIQLFISIFFYHLIQKDNDNLEILCVEKSKIKTTLFTLLHFIYNHEVIDKHFKTLSDHFGRERNM